MASLITVPLWDKIRTRLGLIEKPESGRSFNLSHNAVMTHPLKEIIGTVKSQTASKDISGAGFVTYFTVPAQKHWEVIFVRKEATTGNSQTKITQSSGFANLILGDVGTAATYTFYNPYLPLPYNWNWTLKATGNGADNNITVDMWYIEYDLYI